jgi:diacylglycerol kinase family enzyme
VGNNRLQLEQLGLLAEPQAKGVPLHTPGQGSLTAVMLRPIGTLEMIGLMMRGAMGTLGEAPSVEHFGFERMVVKPARMPGLRRVKVAFDGEVARMRAPLEFRVLGQPMYLLMPPPDATAGPHSEGAGK